ncbi:MAG: hypothetical protein J7M38_09835, partial [Armatimonadetes bacterium]|nr:hypothetical protein [Armatimonadota bacterium]
VLARSRIRSRIGVRIALPAATAVGLAVAMVLYFAVSSDLRALTSAGRYMLAASAWGAVIVAGAGERLALMLSTRSVRIAIVVTTVTASLLLGVGFLAIMTSWYSRIG